MTGFIRGFFSKSKSNEAETPAPAPVERPKKEKAARPPRASDAFFLDATEAQTYGNLEYMKAAKKIRRTFPKTLDNPEAKEYIQELSAMGRIVNGKAEIEIVPATENTTTDSPTIEVQSTPRRSAGSDMDIFRKMAKDIRK
jgi:hypothetical protein